MRWWIVIAATTATAILGIFVLRWGLQSPSIRSVDETVLREYVGVYQWDPNSFVYLQLWNDEFTGRKQLAAIDESGEVRTLYPTDHDRFFTGPGISAATEIESRVEFQRNELGKVTSLTWPGGSALRRTGKRVEIEKWEDVRIPNGDIHLAGTLITPNSDGVHPAIVLVHGSGPADRDSMLPFARFLIRHGMAILAYDKRGVAASTGDWNTASFEDLAGDVVAAFEYLRTRSDIDGSQIGLLGVSQAGWVMPLAAVREKDLAFLISVSGPGVPAAETTIDHARAEMTASGMQPQTTARLIEIMKLQYRFARTGEGWDEYAGAVQNYAAQMGPPPDTFPRTPDDPYFEFIRRLYFYDPVPTLRQLQVPVLALFGELDNNVLPDKNRGAWKSALEAGGNRDYTLHVLPKANHIMLEAKVGNNAEMPSLQRFVPSYYTIIRDWLSKQIRGFSGLG